ncbi:hypothetical protein CRG98_034808 [Punica granatum]|uniref:Uncharacterized protein n=1 Tax=Punica granatum TaxID=22663 RepID=A0A2I0IMG8_PUNGR|nr:hypothetical protein CRG98_034808 [Punica granatum]
MRGTKNCIFDEANIPPPLPCMISGNGLRLRQQHRHVAGQLPRPILPPPTAKDTSLAKPPQVDQPTDANADPDLEPFGGDFEFYLEDPVAMLPTDELFSDGKLVLLQVLVLKPVVRAVASMNVSSPDLVERPLAESTASRRNSTSSSLSNPKSFKNFLHRGSKASSSSDSSLNVPLLKDLDSDSIMISSHLSLSSSSFGGYEHEEVF